MNTMAQAQLNIRSTFARERTAALTRETGMTTTQIIEEALRAYVPPTPAPAAGNLVRKGPLLVVRSSGRSITLAEANEALEQARLGSE